ncbi:LOW QUALITY PROTEIN: hypothetical protein U9M48_011083 [Paspalum notatum var. saurae]|uniref:Uncharacterized protein n=1 Tax=Paspalum notatum var. saurae TaxID=547442 RepID=A0AAQ3SUP2_PASNO
MLPSLGTPRAPARYPPRRASLDSSLSSLGALSPPSSPALAAPTHPRPSAITLLFHPKPAAACSLPHHDPTRATSSPPRDGGLTCCPSPLRAVLRAATPHQLPPTPSPCCPPNRFASADVARTSRPTDSPSVGLNFVDFSQQLLSKMGLSYVAASNKQQAKCVV